MNIETAREVAARIWCDDEMSSVEMDTVLAEEIAQLLSDRLPQGIDVFFDRLRKLEMSLCPEPNREWSIIDTYSDHACFGKTVWQAMRSAEQWRKEKPILKEACNGLER